MWSTEVHECRLEQALQDSIALHRSRKYGTPPPRADAASLNAINVTVIFAAAGCVVANRVRKGRCSWILKAWRWARRQGQADEDGRDAIRAATSRAALQRKAESAQVSGRSAFKFPAASHAQSSSSIDPSFADEATALVSRHSGTNKSKPSAKKKKKGKR